MSERDELLGTLCNTVCNASLYTKRAQPYLLGSDMSAVLDKTADAILAAGYRKVFDGDCGLSNVKDPTDREAAEAWMRWANFFSGNGHDGIAAMKRMLTELGYRKPRTITTTQDLESIPEGAVVLDSDEWVLRRSRLHWRAVASSGLYSHDAVGLPATVLYSPEPTA